MKLSQSMWNFSVCLCPNYVSDNDEDQRESGAVSGAAGAER